MVVWATDDAVMVHVGLSVAVLLILALVDMVVIVAVVGALAVGAVWQRIVVTCCAVVADIGVHTAWRSLVPAANLAPFAWLLDHRAEIKFTGVER